MREPGGRAGKALLLAARSGTNAPRGSHLCFVLLRKNKMTKARVLLFVSLIVAAELTSFALLQKSIDTHAPGKVAAAMLLFGIVVPLAFRETLRDTPIAVSNLYWIVASSLGSVALGSAFGQTLTSREYAAIALLIAATVIQFGH